MALTGVKPKLFWQGDCAHIAFPDGGEFPTNICKTSLSDIVVSERDCGAKVVRVGSHSLWGDTRWHFFPCDHSAACATKGSSVFGVVSTKTLAVWFELSCVQKDGTAMFLVGMPGEDSSADVDMPLVAADPGSTIVLSSRLQANTNLRCLVKEQDDRLLVLLVAVPDREAVVFVWRQENYGASRSWRREGDTNLVLPLGIGLSGLLDNTNLDDKHLLIKQSGRPDLRFEIDIPDGSKSRPAGVRWNYGPSVWDARLASDDPDILETASALVGSLGWQANVLCDADELPMLSSAWRDVAWLASRRKCEMMQACPVYVEARRDAVSAGLSAVLGSISEDSVFLILDIIEPPACNGLVEEGRKFSDEAWELIRQIRTIATDKRKFQCVILGSFPVADTIFDSFVGFNIAQVLGPYSEMPDSVISQAICNSAPEKILGDPDEILAAFRIVKQYCLNKWEDTSKAEGEEYSSSTAMPFILPVAQTYRLLYEAVNEADDDGKIMGIIVNKLAALDRRGAREIPSQLRSALAEFPLLLKENSETLYGQDEAVQDTHQHLKAHVLRMGENKPTFVFYVGTNGVGKTTLARNSVHVLGGALEEINCASLDNGYGYGDRAGSMVLSKAIGNLRMSPHPLKALLLDEVDKNISVLKALIRLTDSDSSDAKGILEHPLAGIFVFITLNVLPNCDEYKKFAGADDPQDRMECLRDLIAASVKDISDTKIIHAIISRLMPYMVFFEELNAENDRGRQHMNRLVEDEARDFSKEYGVRVVIDDEAADDMIKRISCVSIGGFRSVRSRMRREIEAAVGNMYLQYGEFDKETIVLRDGGGKLAVASAEESDAALYVIAVARYKRITDAIRQSIDRMLDAFRLRGDDKIRLDQYEVLAVSYRSLTEKPLFSTTSTESGKAEFVLHLVDLVVPSDADRVRELKQSIEVLQNKVENISLALLDCSAHSAVDAMVREIVDDAGGFYRLSLPQNPGEIYLPDAPPWMKNAWDAYLDSGKQVQLRIDAAKKAFAEFTSDWEKFTADQEESLSNVRKFPELRADAIRRGRDFADSIRAKAKNSGVDRSVFESLHDMVLDASLNNKDLSDEDVLKELDLDIKNPMPKTVHLLGGAAVSFLLDKIIRDMLNNEYSVANKKRTEPS